jgi:tripartite ATP-independent transporter DctM subunit
MIAVIVFAVFFFGLILLGMPIVFVFGVAGIAGLSVLRGFGGAINVIVDSVTPIMTSWTFAAIPLFVLMGMFATYARVAPDAYEVAEKTLGRFPGGLGLTVVGTCTMLGATTGSGFTAIAALGDFSTREMEKRGYKPAFGAATIAAGSILGGLIPPSTAAVIYGSLMEVSIGKVLFARFLPGLLTAAFYVLMIMVRAKMTPDLAPPSPKVPFKETLRALPKVWSVVVIFVVVIGGIMSGIFTPTEAAGIGVVFVLLLGLFKTRFKWQPLKEGLSAAGGIVGMLFGYLILVGIVKTFFALSGLAPIVVDFVGGLGFSPFVMMYILVIPFFIMGFFMDLMAMTMLLIPLYALIYTPLGLDPFLLSVMMAKVSGLGVLTPPYGSHVIVMHGIRPEIPLWGIYKEGFWFIGMDIICLVVISVFPALSLWLPEVLFG